MALDGSTIHVVQRCALVLDCFTADRPRLRAADIHQATGLPTSTVDRLLRTLVSENLLQRQGLVYSIGLRVTAWSAAAKAGSDLIVVARPLLEKLRDDCGESCGLYVRQGHSRVSVVQVESTKSVAYRGYVGQVLPLSAGAAGKIFMAFDRGAYHAALDEGLTAYTRHSVVDVDILDEQIEETAEQGWSFTQEERELGLNSVAAPVFGSDGRIAAVVAAGGPSFRLTADTAAEFATMVTACATSISGAILGHAPAKDRTDRGPSARSNQYGRGGRRKSSEALQWA